MAEYLGNLASFQPTPTFPETASSAMELAHQFPHLLHSNIMDLLPAMSNSNHVFPQTSELLPLMFNENVSSGFFASDPALGLPHPVASGGIVDQKDGKKRKAAAVSDTSSGISSSTAVFENHGLGGKEKNSGNNNCGGGKRRSNEKQVGKPKEVIHVRAKRGQATDSHSLAERVRREKINERMKCLQELVPGCHKTMGMAVMLDEIINYVQSLHNQVEFLSMKLTAASSFVDFNSDTEILGTQQGTSAYEAQDVDWLVREAYGGAATFHSTLPL